MLSIIIPIWNKHDMTDECIQSVMENTESGTYNIVLIDNGSDPPYKPPFSGFNDIHVIRNEENTGFPHAANQGIKAATGDVVVLFNNDIVCTPRWAERLLGWLDEFDIVAPMSNLVGGMQQTVIGSYQSRDELDEASETFSQENEGLYTEVNFAVVSMFIKKSIFDDIGYLDESLWPCCGEDLDFGFRAREAGYRIAIANDVYVHHEMSQTFKAMQDAGLTDYGKVVDQNNEHLAKKWGKNFWHNQPYHMMHRVLGDEPIRLNLGCGRYPMAGFINVDQFENVNPDLLANATDLQFPPNSVDEIYCGHMLEHLTWDEGQRALKHWLDILKPAGEIRVVVPNFDILARRYLDNPTPGEMKRLNDYEMYSYVQESPHKYFYSAELLKFAMNAAGFKKIERLPIDHEYFVENVDWQVGFSGIKQ